MVFSVPSSRYDGGFPEPPVDEGAVHLLLEEVEGAEAVPPHVLGVALRYEVLHRQSRLQVGLRPPEGVDGPPDKGLRAVLPGPVGPDLHRLPELGSVAVGEVEHEGREVHGGTSGGSRDPVRRAPEQSKT